ncbi:hypothetical protein RJ639_001887 [Escallonia herrerae]|uniref:Uncharacterized protein n=1 Tax=Escallonia herrerae TaxID=1293975 RepID=A0AA88X947_9ASTE|nr:hypothetical protein RJ639_001887 [Escallonia herrerae]
MGAAPEANEYPRQTWTKPQHVSTFVDSGRTDGVNGARRPAMGTVPATLLASSAWCYGCCVVDDLVAALVMQVKESSSNSNGNLGPLFPTELQFPKKKTC